MNRHPLKDRSEATSPAVSTKKPPQAIAAPSEHAGDNSNVIVFRARRRGPSPEGPEPTPFIGCSPVRHRIEDFRLNIIAAARQGRHYRSIAAQYGLNALEVWKIVTDALAAEQWKSRRAA